MNLPAISGRSDKIRQAATKERRSALYRWMLANFDDFKATVEKPVGRTGKRCPKRSEPKAC